jgi:hypothetical protein
LIFEVLLTAKNTKEKNTQRAQRKKTRLENKIFLKCPWN